jgi:hypothetical protein
MLQRYLSVGAVPELRPDPIQHEKVGTELEVVIPLECMAQIEDLIRKIRYARTYGDSTIKLWVSFSKLIYPDIVSERDRMWFKRNVMEKFV